MTYRNLQEQVQKNKTDIEAWTNVQFTLNNMGITVLGRVDTSVDIPDKSYEYGDAYLVGTVDPYDIYIYTRTTDPNVSGTFINLGPLSIAGPQGPKGEKGKDGVDGYAPVVRYGNGLPIVEATDKNGYLYIDQQTSKLYAYNNGWNYVIDMKGQQGPQGIQGPQGATGTTLSIVSKLSSPSLLPTDFASGQIPKNSAYLVDVNNVNHLYIIIGDQNDYSTWYWLDAGDFNLGSVIYKDEVFQSSINVTDSYNTNTGAVVTDTATNNMNNDLKAQIGDLETLGTTDKSSIVNAINEVKSNAGGGLELVWSGSQDVKIADYNASISIDQKYKNGGLFMFEYTTVGSKAYNSSVFVRLQKTSTTAYSYCPITFTDTSNRPIITTLSINYEWYHLKLGLLSACKLNSDGTITAITSDPSDWNTRLTIKKIYKVGD